MVTTPRDAIDAALGDLENAIDDLHEEVRPLDVQTVAQLRGALQEVLRQWQQVTEQWDRRDRPDDTDPRIP